MGYAGAAAQRKFDKQAVDLVAHQLREQINALDEKSIAVQEKWHQKRSTAMKSAAPAFPENTAGFAICLAPLMQWLDVRGQSDAMRFDMDILAAQTARYTNPEELDVLWPVIVEKVERLPPHLAQVQQQGPRINQLRDLGWWKQASTEELEDIRIHLRGIMHLMERRDAKIWFDTGRYYRRCEPDPDRDPQN